MPSTGGIFVIRLHRAHRATGEPGSSSRDDGDDDEGVVSVAERTIWDRKEDGGFPETKELKNRVRNVIEPGRSLGHTDRALEKGKEKEWQESGDDNEVGKDKEANGQRAGGVEDECKDC